MIHPEHPQSAFWEALSVVIYSFATALLVWLSDWYKTKRGARSKPHKPVEATTSVTQTQHDILDRLLHECVPMPTRAYMSKFHNGDTYVDGSDILRKSRVVEVTAAGVTHESEKFRAILISTIPEEMAFVQEDGPGWFVTKNLPLSNFRELMERCGVTAGARCCLRKNNHMIGFIGLDFDLVDPPTEAPPGLNEKLENYARWLETTLNQ